MRHHQIPVSSEDLQFLMSQACQTTSTSAEPAVPELPGQMILLSLLFLHCLRSCTTALLRTAVPELPPGQMILLSQRTLLRLHYCTAAEPADPAEPALLLALHYLHCLLSQRTLLTCTTADPADLPTC